MKEPDSSGADRDLAAAWKRALDSAPGSDGLSRSVLEAIGGRTPRQMAVASVFPTLRGLSAVAALVLACLIAGVLSLSPPAELPGAQLAAEPPPLIELLEESDELETLADREQVMTALLIEGMRP